MRLTPVRPTRRRVLLHCDDRRRDAVTIYALALLLRARGYEVRISNRTDLRAYARTFDPEIVMLSHSWTPFSPGELRQISKSAAIIVLPTEGAIASPGNIVRVFAGTPPEAAAEERRAHTAHVTRVLMWGDAMKRAVVEEGIYREDQVAVVGNPRFDVYRSGYFDDLRRARRQTEVVGIVGSSPVSNPFDQRNPIAYFDAIRLDEGKKFPAGKQVEDFLWYVYGGLRVQFEFMHALARRNAALLSLRAHPYEYARNYEFFRDKLRGFSTGDNAEPFYAWLARMRAIVTVSSTTVVEGFVTGTPVITLEPLLGATVDQHMPRDTDYRLPILRYCHRPRSTDEAVDMALKACRGELEDAAVDAQERAAWMKDYYNWPSEESALLGIAAHVDEIAGRAGTLASGPEGWPMLLRRLSMYGEMGRDLSKYVALALLSWSLVGRRANARFYTYQFSHFFPWHRRDCLEAQNLLRYLLDDARPRAAYVAG